MKKYIFTLLIMLVSVSICTANTIIIPDNYPTIQAGINAANNGDSILVKPGTYNPINYRSKELTILSKYEQTQDTTYINNTIIAGDSTTNIVDMSHTSNSILNGFSIINGDWGIYIYNEFSSDTTFVKNCIIKGNNAAVYYLNLRDIPIVVDNCIVYNNDDGIKLKGFYDPLVTNSKIYGQDTGISIIGTSPGVGEGSISAEINNCSFETNKEECIKLDYATVNIEKSIFDDNKFVFTTKNNPPSTPNKIYMINSTLVYNDTILNNITNDKQIDTLDISNSIIWNNTDLGFTGVTEITYTNIQGGWTGEGNIDADPLFADSANGDYSLQWNSNNFSPCIDAGDPDMTWDADNTPPDMGAITAIEHDYFYDQYDEGYLDNVDWLSFPVLNRTTDGYTEALGLLERQGLITLNTTHDDDILDYVVFEDDNKIYFDDDQWVNILPPDSCFHSYQGYKFHLQAEEPDDTVRIGVSGSWQDPSQSIQLYANQENWVGCYLEEPESINDAFASIEEELLGIKSEHWAIKYPNPLISPEWTANPGELYIIDVQSNCQLVWDNSKNTIEPYIKEMTDYFDYEEKLDYMPINVDTVYGSIPEEIAVYSGDECLGASKVNGEFPVQILAYTPNSGSKDNLQFMLYYGGSKHKTKAVSDYWVYSNKLSTYIDKPLKYNTESLVSVRLNTKEEPEPQIEFGLFGNYPNPVNSNITNISFAPAKNAQSTEIKIYNVRGQLVRKLDCSNAIYNKAGIPTVSWDCKDSRGNKVQSGVYFYKLISGKKQAVKKMVIVQ